MDDLVLAVNHLSEQLRAEVAARNLQSRVILSIEEKPLGTGGPLKLAESLLENSDPVVAVNGDVVSNIDVTSLLSEHSRSGADATVALVSVKDPRPFGLADVDSKDWIDGFEEKSPSKTGPGWINAGVYVLSQRVIRRIPEGRAVSLEREIFPDLARELRLRAWRHNGFWYDIGKIQDYVLANRDLLKSGTSLPAFRGRYSGGRIAEAPSYAGADCAIDKDAKIGPYTILSPKVSVGGGSVVRKSIVFEESSIGRNCTVDDSIIGERVRLGEGVKIGAGSVVAGEISLADRTVINPGSMVLN